MIQSGAVEMGLCDHEVIYCSQKASLFKLNENHSDEFYVEKLTSIKFSY